MDLDNILDKLSTKVDKAKTYLKGLYNKEKADLTDQFGDAIDDNRIMMLSLLRIGKKYGLDKSDVDKLTNDDDFDDIPSITDDSIDDLIDDDDYTDMSDTEEINIETPANKSGNNDGWKKFLATIPDPMDKANIKYERTPSLIKELGATYYLKLTDPSKEPYTHEFTGKYGTYDMHAVKVTLVKVSDEDLYDVFYKDGDFKGQKAFQNDKNYTLWLDDKAMGFFKYFLNKHFDDIISENVVFTFKWTKKGNYNVWTFKLAS